MLRHLFFHGSFMDVCGHVSDVPASVGGIRIVGGVVVVENCCLRIAIVVLFV